MFVMLKKGTPGDGNRPTLLSAYGGYGAITLPFYSTEAAVWVRAGGIYALARWPIRLAGWCRYSSI